jgi:hypothetical protein
MQHTEMFCILIAINYFVLELSDSSVLALGNFPSPPLRFVFYSGASPAGLTIF